MNSNAKMRFKKSVKEAREQLRKYMIQGYRILYIDETMITRSTI